jgi:DNA-binding CsgD family transcriptional regulator
LALLRGDARVAYAHFRDSVLLRREIAELPGLVASLVAFARLAALLNRPRRAVRLASAAAALYHSIGPALAAQDYRHSALSASTMLAPTHPEVDRAQRRLGPVQRTAAWDEGRALPLAEAIAEALGLENELPGPHATPNLPTELTRREREVAGLLARGSTNRQIAAALVITEGSAHVQVGRLLNKLGFHTRAEVAVWAANQHL